MYDKTNVFKPAVKCAKDLLLCWLSKAEYANTSCVTSCIGLLMYTIVLHSLYKKDIQTSSCCTYFTFISFTYFTFILFSCFSFSFVLLSRQKCSHSKWTKKFHFSCSEWLCMAQKAQNTMSKLFQSSSKDYETFFSF